MDIKPKYVIAYCKYCDKEQKFAIHMDDEERIICLICGINRFRKV